MISAPLEAEAGGPQVRAQPVQLGALARSCLRIKGWGAAQREPGFKPTTEKKCTYKNSKMEAFLGPLSSSCLRPARPDLIQDPGAADAMLPTGTPTCSSGSGVHRHTHTYPQPSILLGTCTWMNVLIHSFNKHFLGAYVPGTRTTGNSEASPQKDCAHHFFQTIRAAEH